MVADIKAVYKEFYTAHVRDNVSDKGDLRRQDKYDETEIIASSQTDTFFVE